jgi:hypothetical protein
MATDVGEHRSTTETSAAEFEQHKVDGARRASVPMLRFAGTGD